MFEAIEPTNLWAWTHSTRGNKSEAVAGIAMPKTAYSIEGRYKADKNELLDIKGSLLVNNHESVI